MQDTDECAVGTHNCGALGPGYLCRNIQVLSSCWGTKKILENENCSGILPLREETVQRGRDLGRERALHKVVKKYEHSLL